MKRSKRYKVKEEVPEASSSRASSQKEHDLAYYIHDRVELMHQAFSVLKHKELKAMAPECVRHISISDLQELCMEELLGISSKRLCAILDGAEPPSDTESSSESSPDRLETISLDSISSDEEILSQVSSKKSKKHKHHSRSKSKKHRSKHKAETTEQQQEDRSRRAGLTMLELLELQARARAIRAQLQKEQAIAPTMKPSETVVESSDDEVEIKEEAAEVLEISSDDEKPNLQELADRIAATRKEKESENTSNTSKTITKKVNDLVITVPQTKSSRKIKLKRNTSNSNTQNVDVQKNASNIIITVVQEKDKNSNKRKETDTSIQITNSKSVETTSCDKNNIAVKTTDNAVTDKDKSKDKKKKRKKDKQKDKEGSDHDEITLQLSDTEKMDLLEDLEGKPSNKRVETEESEDSSEDSSSDSDEDNDNTVTKTSDPSKEVKVTESTNVCDVRNKNTGGNESNNSAKDVEEIQSNEGSSKVAEEHDAYIDLDKDTDTNDKNDKSVMKEKVLHVSSSEQTDRQISNVNLNDSEQKTDKNQELTTESNIELIKSNDMDVTVSDKQESRNELDNDAIIVTNISDIPLQTEDKTESEKENVQVTETDVHESVDKEKESSSLEIESQNEIQETNSPEISNNKETPIEVEETSSNLKVIQNKDTESQSDSITKESENASISNTNIDDTQRKQDDTSSTKEASNEKSEGELSDRDSSEVEASDFKTEIVCISDEEEKSSKKKKKKDKKSKKEKKSKKKKDFRESADQNFYTQTDTTREHDDVILIPETESPKNNFETNLHNLSQKDTRTKENNDNIEIKSKITEITLEDAIEGSTPIIEASPRSEIISNTDVDDDVYEYLELSDDSSCYEVEEISISKEPTTEEIEALSSKMDEIDRDRDTIAHETEKDTEPENISWKDRYLKSTKVKKVLTTASIMNAIRKKNLELKKKLAESKEKEKEEVSVPENTDSNVIEGSIDQYNALEGSTKYVDPVKEVDIEKDTRDNNSTDNKTVDGTIDKENPTEKGTVTNEMKREAKQLLKMYKMLLKHNDMKRADRSKKKKKSKKKDKGAEQASVAS